MINKIVDGFSRWCVWQDELPPSVFVGENILRNEVHCTRVDELNGKQNEIVVGLEVFINRGPRIIYGHIGGSFKLDENSSEIIVEIPFVENLITKCELELASGAGASFVGLEKLYAEATISGVSKVLAKNIGLPPGKIVINAGAISKLSSSPVVYEKLGMKICEMFFRNLNNEEIDESFFKLDI